MHDARLGIGILLVVVGAVTLLWGDRRVRSPDSWLMRQLSWTRGHERWMKWPVGLGFIYAGVQVLIHGWSR